jgi:hypothetical protein
LQLNGERDLFNSILNPLRGKEVIPDDDADVDGRIGEDLNAIVALLIRSPPSLRAAHALPRPIEAEGRRHGVSRRPHGGKNRELK